MMDTFMKDPIVGVLKEIFPSNIMAVLTAPQQDLERDVRFTRDCRNAGFFTWHDVFLLKSVKERMTALDGCVSSYVKAANVLNLCPDGNKDSQWDYIFDSGGHLKSQCLTDFTKLASLAALLELNAQLDVIVFDDLPFLCPETKRSEWDSRLEHLASAFRVHTPFLPVRKVDLTDDSNLINFVRYEMGKIRRPTAAIVDLHWKPVDASLYGQSTESVSSEKKRSFGLRLIRMIRAINPTIPIFVWSNLGGSTMVQRALQQGATFFFNKPQSIRFDHDDTDEGPRNFLTPAKLWVHILEWEASRSEPPPSLAKEGIEFFIRDSANSRKMFANFLKIYQIDEYEDRHAVVEILRSLIPEATRIEILKILGHGRSGNMAPFLVRGLREDGSFLKPLQIKITKNWRSLAKERKGYRDVVEPVLGPTVSHYVRGPFRIGEWSGMAQTFAAPEETYLQATGAWAESLDNVIRDNLNKPDLLSLIVESVFDRILEPFYKSKLNFAQQIPLHHSFLPASPAHLHGTVSSVDATEDPKDEAEDPVFDFSPENLSRKDNKARQEEAFYIWGKLKQHLSKEKSAVIKGLVIDTLECKGDEFSKYRLRLIDNVLGIKVDLNPADSQIALRWKHLEVSPIKLRRAPVEIRIQIPDDADPLMAWSTLYGAGVEGARGCIELAENLMAVGETSPTDYIMRCHPLDYADEFTVGPLHGDLNTSNILIHRVGKEFFPWLIDFDSSEKSHPIIYDLIKLEIEATHRIGATLFQELTVTNAWSKERFIKFLEGYEKQLFVPDLGKIDHLLSKRTPDFLRDKLNGFFVYLHTVRKKSREYVSEKEWLLGIIYYGISCLKFSNLYNIKDNPAAPFASQVVLYKVQIAIRLLDESNGISSDKDADEPGGHNIASKIIIQDLIWRIRTARREGPVSLGDLLIRERDLGGDRKSPLDRMPSSFHERLVKVFRLLRDDSLPGENRWFREVLWYIRDFGIGSEDQVADFTMAMVLASTDDNSIPSDLYARDYASTGRVGNTYPIAKMFESLRKLEDNKLGMDDGQKTKPFCKMSSRGESGGTIDILENAGVRICSNLDAVKFECDMNGWAVAEAGQNLCEIDKILFRLRKNTNCMKVDDLVISSITAKKLAIGISKFDLEIATGYDAKFRCLRNNQDIENKQNAIHKRWVDILKKIHELAKGNERRTDEKEKLEEEAVEKDYICELEHVNTNKLQPLDKGRHIVLGSGLLAALVFHSLQEEDKHPRYLLPDECTKVFDDLYKLISAASIFDIEPRFNLTAIPEEEYLHNISWGICNPLPIEIALKPKMGNLAAIVIRMPKFDRNLVNVPFFDRLYSQVSLHPFSGVVFVRGDKIEERGLFILLPQNEIPSDIDLFCWRILREGFVLPDDNTVSIAERKYSYTHEAIQRAVHRIGPVRIQNLSLAT
jgi:hypothetical protein